MFAPHASFASEVLVNSPVGGGRRIARRAVALMAAAAMTLVVTACGGTGDSSTAQSGTAAVVPQALQLLRDLQVGLPGAPDDTVTLVNGRQDSTLNGKPWSAVVQDIHVSGALGGETVGAVGILNVTPGDGATQVYLLATDTSGASRRSAVFPLGLDVQIERMAVLKGQIGVTFSDPSTTKVRQTHFRLVAFGMQTVEPPLMLITGSDGPYKPVASVKTMPAWRALVSNPTSASGTVAYHESRRYSFEASAGQSVSVGVTSAHNDVYISLRPTGVAAATNVVDEATKTSQWSGTLPSAGTYEVTVFTTNGAGTAFTLTAEAN